MRPWTDYATDDLALRAAAKAWCVANGYDPDRDISWHAADAAGKREMRIVPLWTTMLPGVMAAVAAYNTEAVP